MLLRSDRLRYAFPSDNRQSSNADDDEKYLSEISTHENLFSYFFPTIVKFYNFKSRTEKKHRDKLVSLAALYLLFSHLVTIVALQVRDLSMKNKRLGKIPRFPHRERAPNVAFKPSRNFALSGAFSVFPSSLYIYSIPGVI